MTIVRAKINIHKNQHKLKATHCLPLFTFVPISSTLVFSVTPEEKKKGAHALKVKPVNKKKKRYLWRLVQCTIFFNPLALCSGEYPLDMRRTAFFARRGPALGLKITSSPGFAYVVNIIEKESFSPAARRGKEGRDGQTFWTIRGGW